MFPCAGTPLALPYQEFTKGPPALSRDASERPGTSGRGMAAGELPPLKRHDIAKGWEGCKGERRAPQKNPPHERKNTLFPVGRIQLLAEAKVS
ncbi:hypothetical protein NXV68_07560 [Bacteroides fragilis]|nr:hypothetical protein [Bacteroides fragilis]